MVRKVLHFLFIEACVGEIRTCLSKNDRRMVTKDIEYLCMDITSFCITSITTPQDAHKRLQVAEWLTASLYIRVQERSQT